MKTLLIALTLLAPALAQAASPEESYFAARDGYIKTLTAADLATHDMEQVTKQHQAALDDLEKQLLQIIGPSVIAGFPAKAKINLDTLVKHEEGFGMLDALAYATEEEKAQTVVTSLPLLKAWMRAHRNWWKDEAPLPQDIGKIIAVEIFYSQTTVTDSRVFRFAEIPIAKPAKAQAAYAMMTWRAQDIMAGTPTDITLSVVRDNRIFIVRQPIGATLTPIPACDAIWKAFEKRSEQENEANLEAQRQGKKPKPFVEAPREAASTAFYKCYNQQAKNQPFFAAVKQQAQAIVDGLPEK